MKIELSKEQYKDLITMSAISGSIFGILGDMLEDSSYKKRSSSFDKLEEHLLSYAKEFGCDNLVEKFEGKKILDQKFYENKIMPILEDYDEFALYDNISHKLARRDFEKDHTEADIRKMAKENGGYFGVAMFDYEKKYWEEFDKHGYGRLEIKNETK